VCLDIMSVVLGHELHVWRIPWARSYFYGVWDGILKSMDAVMIGMVGIVHMKRLAGCLSAGVDQLYMAEYNE